MKLKRTILMTSAVAAIAVVVLCIQVFTGSEDTDWERVAVRLDSESSLLISRKHSHPFLAEYRREVTVIRTGERLETLDYPKDTGGGFPMQISFYANGTRRVVRITDGLCDRLIDLRTGQFIADETPPEGKESSSFIRVDALPPLRKSVEVDSGMKVIPR